MCNGKLGGMVSPGAQVVKEWTPAASWIPRWTREKNDQPLVRPQPPQQAISPFYHLFFLALKTSPLGSLYSMLSLCSGVFHTILMFSSSKNAKEKTLNNSTKMIYIHFWKKKLPINFITCSSRKVGYIPILVRFRQEPGLGASALSSSYSTKFPWGK